MTRAGKATHADAFRAIIFFLRWSNEPEWPVLLDCNNMVVNGQFVNPIPESIKNNPRLASHSSKYPGIALNFEDTRCTPEIYTKRSTFIIPGVTQPHTLSHCISKMASVLTSENSTINDDLNKH